MPNPFHFRAHIDRLSRLAAESNPAYVRLRALKGLVRELMPGTPRARLAQQLLEEANPYEFARHKLRDLYDRPGAVETSPLGGGAPHLCGAEGAGPDRCSAEEELPEEPEEPL